MSKTDNQCTRFPFTLSMADMDWLIASRIQRPRNSPSNASAR
jgi:hypothetical protein